jgi:hypothetical protein
VSRPRRWVHVLAIAALVAALPVAIFSLTVLSALQTRSQGVTGECAEAFEEYKTALRGYHWQWLPYPGWVCEFDRIPGRGHDEPFERRLSA